MSAPPLYQQVKEHIIERIETGALPMNARAPSEAQLVEMFGVSRMTANRALNELAREGLLVRIAGSGTFVADRRARGELVRLKDIAVELAERGHLHEVEVLTRERAIASRKAAAEFETEPGAALLHAVLLHKRDGEPVLLEDRYVNAKLAPDYLSIDFEKTSTYEYLAKAAALEKVEHVIRAIPASAWLAEKLRIEQGAPCLAVNRRTWSRGQVASTATLTYAGERYEISGAFSGDGA